MMVKTEKIMGMAHSAQEPVIYDLDKEDEVLKAINDKLIINDPVSVLFIKVPLGQTAAFDVFVKEKCHLGLNFYFDSADSKFVNFAVEFDFSEMMDDIYNIKKGIKDCAQEYCMFDHFNKIKEYIEKEEGLYVFKDYFRSDEEQTIFFIYRDLITQLFINAVMITDDAILREYLLGKLLGYSEASMEEYMHQYANNLVLDALNLSAATGGDAAKELSGNKNAYSMIGKVQVRPPKNMEVEVIIRGECFPDQEDSSDNINKKEE